MEKTISDGFTDIHVDLNAGTALVELEASQFRLGTHRQYSLFLDGDDHYFKGSIICSDEDRVVISYEIPEGAVSLADCIEDKDNLQRLIIARKTLWIFQKEHGIVNPFINPENIYIVGSDLMVMHRGFQDEIMPYEPDKDKLFRQCKALITYTMSPKTDYEVLVLGGGAVRSRFLRDIQETDSLEALRKLLTDQIVLQKKVEARTVVRVDRRRLGIVKWSLVVTLVMTVLLAALAGFWGLNVLPKKDSVIKAQSEFIARDYSSAVDTLEGYGVDSLPEDARYILAVSYINLDSLSVRQKKAVLNSISQNSSENIFKYWICLGRGDFRTALNIAKNIGDNQYILYSYTKLYSATKADSRMDGVRKQKLLKDYRSQINRYLKTLGGKSNEFKDD